MGAGSEWGRARISAIFYLVWFIYPAWFLFGLFYFYLVWFIRSGFFVFFSVWRASFSGVLIRPNSMRSNSQHAAKQRWRQTD